jgi:hypothetical protein
VREVDPLPAGEIGVTDVRHRPLHPGLVLGLGGPSRVDQALVVLGQLGIGVVELGVIDVGLDDAGFQVVGLLFPVALCGPVAV